MRIQTAEEFAKVNSFGLGQANTAFAKYFIGDSFLNPLTAPGESAVSLEPGTVIVIPPEVKHWHGAKKDSWFAHIAVEVPGEETGNEWLEPVDDAVYGALE